MKRQLLLLLLIAALLTAGVSTAGAAAFPDVEDKETAAAVERLYGLGIVDGYTNGRYQPEALLTRAQFCKLLTLSLGRGEEIALYSHATRFSDVTGSHWAAGYVNLASAAGYINGYGDGSFGPEDSVTYGQAVTILLRALGYTTADIGYYWPQDYVSFAAELGLDADLGLSAYSYLSRGNAALLLVAFLDTPRVSANANGSTSTYQSALAGSTVSNAVLLDEDITSADGSRHNALFYVNGKAAYYQQAEEVDADLLGCSGTIYLDDEGQVSAFVADGTEYEVRKAVYLDADYQGQALFYSKKLRAYTAASTFTAPQVGVSGYLLLNEHNYAAAFVTTNSGSSQTMAAATEDAFYYSAGGSYPVDADATVLYKDATQGWQLGAWSQLYAELSAGKATVYFDDGALELLVFSGQ